MGSRSLGKNQCISAWDSLPLEVRLLIFNVLIQDGCPLARLATVSREWQTELERHNFARIKITPARLTDFNSMTCRNRALVTYIWFCLELDIYDCTKCAPTPPLSNLDDWVEEFSFSDAEYCLITTSFECLFSILSTWDHNSNLILDISIFSRSDSEHWFKYMTIAPDTADVGSLKETQPSEAYHDPQHGWNTGIRHSAPPLNALRRVFFPIMDDGPFDSEEKEMEWWDDLPSVTAVTTLLLRQQNRRRWKPNSLAHMFARLPRLQEVHYEPWREWCSTQRLTDKDYQFLFTSLKRTNTDLKRLVVFENFNQQYPVVMQRFMQGEDLAQCDSLRQSSPAVTQTIALASFKLEHLAVSFLADASHFFEIKSFWEWPNLISLVLTSKLLTPNENSINIKTMLQAAAAAALKMPQLEIMEIWNGRKGLAALFKYQVFRNIQQATITWRGTWELAIEPSTIQSWDMVVHQYDRSRLNLVHELLPESAIMSHGDAMHELKLSSQAIRPISLQQIQTEQKALQGVATV